MAKIVPSSDERVFQIAKFLGLNECPDGDTQLKLGEASAQKNWRVTTEHHLKVRPGYAVETRYSGPVRGLWSGFVNGERKVVCCADGGVWEPLEGRRIGDIEDAPTNMFGFDNKVYFQNGKEYLVWDGDGFVDNVEGYIPLVSVAIAPGGGGTLLENVNRLTGRRRVKFSPDGKATEFHLPDINLLSLDRVELEEVQMVKGWTVDLKTGVITFTEVPPEGQNTLQVWYAIPNSRRPEVESMRFSEFFNGAADTRVFFYGDGTANALYSGVTETGKGNAEYFPDMYEMQVGEENAPITAMSKNYNRLMIYKADGGAYSSMYDTTVLADKKVLPSFTTVSIHREIGNDAPGQVRLVDNVPRTIYNGNLFDWKYANYFSRDERNAKLASEKVQKTMREADPTKVYAFDDDARQEYYLFLNDKFGTVIVNNYQNDTWYLYDGLPVTCACRDGNDLLFGTSDGRLLRFAERITSDDGKAINAYFATGNMSFDRDYKRKHSSQLWVSVKPTAHANLLVTAKSDRRNDYLDKAVSKSLFSFRNMDFNRFTFHANAAPQMERLKLKVKKFVYYKLILKSNYTRSDATVLGVDIRVRYTGNVK